MPDTPPPRGISLGNIFVPPPAAEEKRIKDRFDCDTAFNFAFVGVGQGGGRIAQAFYDLGYDRVCAVNTTIRDLAELQLPKDRKLDLGQQRGAGKDPSMAAELLADKDEDIFDLFKRFWGNEVDYVFVCLAAAGGTGAGGHPKVMEVARRYMAYTKRPEKVGAIVAMPTDDEGQRFAKNAIGAALQLRELNPSPVIFIDNQKMKKLFWQGGSGDEHARLNNPTAGLLHAFNQLAGADSEHTTFDRADLATLLNSGVITFATDTITEWASPADISTPIRDKLRRNLLGTSDFSKATLAGLVYVLNGTAYDEVQSSHRDHGTAMFTRMLANGSTVFPGVYRGSGEPSIEVLAMVGDLPWPGDRLLELAVLAGTSRDSLDVFLGV